LKPVPIAVAVVFNKTTESVRSDGSITGPVTPQLDVHANQYYLSTVDLLAYL